TGGTGGTGESGGTGGTGESGGTGGGVTNTPNSDPCAPITAVPTDTAMQASTSVVSGGRLRAPITLIWIQFSRIVPKADPCMPNINVNDDVTEITDEEWA
ncbi:MAG TPA: hypothetical protein VM347_29175, partial [Nonomuraea sp.]|nr:hypothetical protein [Nonomuraea sp.]